MKERPILFSAPMVHAILDGRKTQTRRAVKRIPWREGVNPDFSQARAFSNAGEFRIAGSEEMTEGFRCPYGAPGDRLWVRETWGYRGSSWSSERPDVEEQHIDYRADGMRRTFTRARDDESGLPKQREPRPDEDYYHDYYNGYLDRYWKAWRPSIHMPRWACRLVLEVTEVRVERLQEISREDEIAEGTPDGMFFDALWSSINGAESWAANPWVWVVSFRRIP